MGPRPGDFLGGWHNSICPRFRSDCRWLPCRLTGWCIASFCNSISDFIFCCHCEMIQFCRFLSARWGVFFFGAVAGNICMPGMLCIYVSVFYFFVGLRAVINQKRNANCAQICCIRRKYLLYCMAIKAPRDWQAKWNIFWVISCSWKCSGLKHVKVCLSLDPGEALGNISYTYTYKSIRYWCWKSNFCHRFQSWKGEQLFEIIITGKSTKDKRWLNFCWVEIYLMHLDFSLNHFYCKLYIVNNIFSP